MYRLMIIDDDKAIREHIKESIPWESMELELAAEASEGEEAMALFMQYEPHIVLTDINIPLIDGMELARRFAEREKDIQIVLITGFGTLEYAREAIKAGTVDFLLKPLDSGELIGALQKAVDNIKKKTEELAKFQRMEEILQENLPLLQDRYMLEVLEGAEETEEELMLHMDKLNLEIVGSNFQVVALVPDFGRMKIADKEIFQFALQNMISEIGNEYHLVCRVLWKDFSQGFVFIQMKNPDKEAAEKMMMRVRDKLQTYSHYDFQAGIGSLVDSMKKLPVSCEGARQALDYSNIYGRNHVTMIENVLVLEEREPIRLEKEMAEVLRYSDSSGFLDIRQAIGNYMNRLMIASKGSFSCIQKECIKLLSEILTSCQEIRWDMEGCFTEDPYFSLLQCREPLELQGVLLDVCGQIKAYKQQQSQKKGKRVIEKAKLYIREHYKEEELNLSQVSEAIGLSAVYFCSLFKEETGFTFVEYLNMVRIEQAKELLRNSNMKIYQIALEAGYSNPSYFYEGFKKLTGKRPREYAENPEY